ncbi:MAG: amidohydrolase family protein [Euryarchaeota archaeon]|jgi:imidazolonepropionase-like amidohydrolase|nr:amidohydrolase family protein [Euryarchaeota archaeon]
MGYILIHNGTVIDGNGGQPVQDGGLLIRDNVVQEVGSLDSVRLPPHDVEEIDANGGFILPGFIDCHVHIMLNGFRFEDPLFTPLSYYFFQAGENLRQTLEAGVTTVRDAGLADYGVKRAVDDGLIPGPRLQISVMPLSITGGHFDLCMKSGIEVKTSYSGLPDSVCDGAHEVRKRVREVLRAGADVVKVMVTGGVMSPNDSPEHPQFSREELGVMVEEASYRGICLMAHAHGAQGIKNALKAGITSIEHGTFLDEECLDLLLEKDGWLIPTLLVNQHNQEMAEKGKLPEYSHGDSQEVARILERNMKIAYQAGVKMAMGTDSGIAPHGQNLRELSLLCGVGMTPMEAIQAGTIRAAELLGWDHKIGTLEQGKLADVVVCKDDPLDRIDSLGDPENINLVLKAGKLVKDLRHEKVE